MPPRIQLAARRRAYGYSQESLAQLLQVTTSAVSRWEQGTSTPKAVYRQPLAKALEMNPAELERLLDVEGAQIAAAGNGSIPAWLGHYAALEQSASVLQTFEPLVIPGLLQIDAYAREVERAYHESVSPDEVQRRADVRLARQEVLGRKPHPLELHCLIDESVLHRTLGGQAVMGPQLTHLLSMAELPNIEIQIVAMENAPYGAAFGAFQLLTSLGSSEPYLACSEDLTGKRYHDQREVVAAHRQLFRHLADRAMDPETSKGRIREQVESSGENERRD